DQADGQGEEAVLLGLDPLVEAVLVVAGLDRDGGLEQHRAVVDLLGGRGAGASPTAWAPRKAGSRLGWVLRMRSGKARTNDGPRMRMNPARQTTSGRAAATRSRRARSNDWRSGWSAGRRTAGAIPARRARSSPWAPGRSAPTRTTAIPEPGSAAASSSAWRFEPGADTSTTTARA